MGSAKKRVTLSVDSEVYGRYRSHCTKSGIILSKQIELFIKSELERVKGEGDGNS